MKKSNVFIIVMNAIIAAAYAALTILIAPIAYGEVQLRLTEVMVFLAFYNKKYIPGLVLGCFISNIPSSLGMPDMIFGTLSTLLVCLAMYFIKNKWVAAFIGALITGLIIGSELYFILELPFIMSALYVFIGELIVLIIGVIVFNTIEKNDKLMDTYIRE